MQKESPSEYIDSKKYKRIRVGIEYIHQHYADERITVDCLAEMCGVSSTYFGYIFKNIYGMLPLKYIIALRMKRAGELLSSGQYTVTETAFRSGYNELSHFCRKFKEYYGVSPTEYSVQKRETP
jgi:two-component system response regulator YesN